MMVCAAATSSPAHAGGVANPINRQRNKANARIALSQAHSISYGPRRRSVSPVLEVADPGRTPDIPAVSDLQRHPVDLLDRQAQMLQRRRRDIDNTTRLRHDAARGKPLTDRNQRRVGLVAAEPAMHAAVAAHFVL